MTTPAPVPLQQRSYASGLAIVLAGALAYSLIHVTARLLASNVLGEDDVLDTILSQDLRPGYDAFPRQPPLYNWILWAVQQVMGPGIGGFLLIKYSALIATCGFLYAAAFRATRDRLFSLLTAESLALIYSIGWRYHEGFTHEVGAMVAVSATAWALLRLLDRQRTTDFIVLGLTIGLGFLTEPAFSVFLTTMLIAACLQPSIRARLLRPQLAITTCIALAIASPYLTWLVSDGARLAELWRPTGDRWRDSGRGLFYALRGPFFYLAPLIVFLPIVFPRFLAVAWSDIRRGPNRSAAPDYEQLILHAALVAFLACILGALLLAIKDQAVHVLMPLYVVSVIWLFGVARRAAGTELHKRRFTSLAFAIAGFALAARVANMYVLHPVCKICRWGIPYEHLAAEMRFLGFQGGTIIGIDDELAGNLRQWFPSSTIILRGRAHISPASAQPTRGQVAYVWNATVPDSQVRTLLSNDGLTQRAIADAVRVDVPWRHAWRPLGYRSTSWKFALLPPAP